MLIFQSTNYKAIAIGTSKPVDAKGHRNVTVSTNFVKNETHVRDVTHYDITINKMTEDNYKEMRYLFKENDFSITDTEKVNEGQHYFLDMDEFTLNEVEDKKDKGYYYTGTFRITKY